MLSISEDIVAVDGDIIAGPAENFLSEFRHRIRHFLKYILTASGGLILVVFFCWSSAETAALVILNIVKTVVFTT